MIVVQVDDFSGWRQQARQLLLMNTHPASINWSDGEQSQLNFATSIEQNDLELEPQSRSISIPQKLLRLIRAASCYRDDQALL